METGIFDFEIPNFFGSHRLIVSKLACGIPEGGRKAKVHRTSYAKLQ
jgi:hypothetical protein